VVLGEGEERAVMIVLEVENLRDWKVKEIISLKILDITEIRPGVWRIKAAEVVNQGVKLGGPTQPSNWRLYA
jgi:hypothetical protein